MRLPTSVSTEPVTRPSAKTAAGDASLRRSRTSRTTPSFVRTGQRIETGVDKLAEYFRIAREVCSDLFVAEETRELSAVYDYVPLGFIEGVRKEIAAKLALPLDVFSLDRFSIHGCGPVGLHDDFFRYPRYYFVMVIAHCGDIGLVDPVSRAQKHEAGEIILLDPRRKHGLVQTGLTADEHDYERTHSPVHDPQRQFMFLDFDVARVDLRARFRTIAG